MLRIGVVGGAGTTARDHATALARMDTLVLIALVDTDAARLSALSHAFPGVPAFSTVAEAVTNSSAEAWICASDICDRVPVCKELLGAGKTVLCEQPLSDDVHAAESLAPFVDTGAKGPGQARLMVAQPLFSNEFRRMLHAVRSRGALSYISIDDQQPAANLDPSRSNVETGESIFDTVATQWLAKLFVITGGATPAVFRASSFTGHDSQYGVETSREHLCTAQIMWDTGLVAQITCGFVLPDGARPQSRMHMFGQGWMAKTKEQPMLLASDRVTTDDGATKHGVDELFKSCGVVHPYAELLQEFVQTCRIQATQAPLPSSSTRALQCTTYRNGVAIVEWLSKLKNAAATAQLALPLSIMAAPYITNANQQLPTTWRDAPLVCGTRQYIHPVHAAPQNRGLPVKIITGAVAGPTVVMLAGLRGDEAEGMSALRLTLEEAAKPGGLARGRIVAVMCCNVDAWELGGGSPLGPNSGSDLTRCFPGTAIGNLAERVAFTITQDFIRHADQVVVISTPGSGIFQILPVAGFLRSLTSDKVTTASELRQRQQAALAASCATTAVWSPRFAGRSVLATAQSLSVPAVFLLGALGGAGAVGPNYSALGLHASLHALLQHLHMAPHAPRVEAGPAEDFSFLVEDRPPPRSIGCSEVNDAVEEPGAAVAACLPIPWTDGDRSFASLCRHGGMWLPKKHCGDLVSPGDEIGEVLGVWGDTLQKITAPGTSSMTLLILRSRPRVSKGELLAFFVV